MIGTIVNTAAIILGSTVGSVFNKGIKDRYKERITGALGLVAVSLGITWITKNLGASTEPILFIVSLVIGSIVGEFIDLDGKVNRLSERLRKDKESDTNLMEGLVTAILLFCVGTMSILGPLESALRGDNTLLFTNAILDGMTSMILASTFGIGIIISAGVLFLWQGSIYLSAQFVEAFVNAQILGEISIIGGVLILSTGLNILNICKFKTLNMIPALLVPVLYFAIF